MSIHPYYIAKAREIFTRAGGDPANAMPLAAWAQETKTAIDADPDAIREIGVLVSEDGQIRAEIGLYGTEPRAWYVNNSEYEVAKNLISDKACARIGREIGQKLIQVNIWEAASGPSPERGEKLNLEQVAERAGIGASTFQSYVSRGHAPEPDGTEGRANYWWAWTIEDWIKNRPGRGARTDIEA